MKQEVYLRALLKDKDIRTIDLAEKMGVTQSTLNKKINGKVSFTDKNIDVLKEVLGMSYEEIFKYKISKNVTIHVEPLNLKIDKCNSTVTEVSTGKTYKIPEELTRKIVTTIENKGKEAKDDKKGVV